MSTDHQFSHDVRHSAASDEVPVRSHAQDEADAHEYVRLIASIHEEWERLESSGDVSVMPGRPLMDAILAETRHGAQVEMPPTDLGPYSLSEFSLRALVRRAVDAVPGARALRSSFEHDPATEDHLGLGVPTAITVRVSAGVSVGSLPQLGQQIREAVRSACRENLGVDPTVNVRIEDLHDD